MSRPQQRPVWPLLGLSFSLGVLALLAPQAWQSLVGKPPLASPLGTAGDGTGAAPAPRDLLAETPPAVSAQPAGPVASLVEPEGPPVDWATPSAVAPEFIPGPSPRPAEGDAGFAAADIAPPSAGGAFELPAPHAAAPYGDPPFDPAASQALLPQPEPPQIAAVPVPAPGPGEASAGGGFLLPGGVRLDGQADLQADLEAARRAAQRNPQPVTAEPSPSDLVGPDAFPSPAEAPADPPSASAEDPYGPPADLPAETPGIAADDAAAPDADLEPLDEADAAPAYAGAGAWPYPAVLAAQLERLLPHPYAQEWAAAAHAAVLQLCELPSLRAPEGPAALAELGRLHEQGRRLSDEAPRELRVELERAVFALQRRHNVWTQTLRTALLESQAAPEPATQQVSTGAPAERLVVAARAPTTASGTNLAAIGLEHIQRIESRLQAVREGHQWREYLLLADARSLAQQPEAHAERREFARKVLSRLEAPALTPEQRAFFDEPLFVGWRRDLAAWAAEPVDLAGLLSELERYERTHAMSDSQRVAEQFQALRWSGGPEAERLAYLIETYYRNANVRLAVSGELLNRFMPTIRPMSLDVSDQILGAQVYGRGSVFTRLGVRLLPDSSRLRVAVEARGRVASETSAYHGPVTFYNQGTQVYLARKLLQVDDAGVSVGRSEAYADGYNDVTGIETDFDGVPILSGIARSIAMDKLEENRAAADREASLKTAARIRQRMDADLAAQIARAQEQFQTRVIDPLTRLRLNPAPIDMQTTAERLIVRYRLSGYDQLSAHTPRPQAPVDSLISLQAHETAVNNIIAQIGLDGRETTLHDLYHEAARTFGTAHVSVPPDLPADVQLTFADHDAVRVDLVDGRAALTIRLARLAKGNEHEWKDFVVRATFTPMVQGRGVFLVRDGVIELSGEKLKFGDQVALRGVFSKVFSREQPISLMPKLIDEDPRLADLEVTQFVLADGWVGLALGAPQGSADYGRMSERLRRGR